jgi:acyl-coenzyme A synthetase/AMP-(fatty) acid ligase
MSRIDPRFVGVEAERWPVPSVGRRLSVLVGENRRLTMSSFTGILADLYENRPLFFLDQPIQYPFFSGSEVSFRTLSRFVNRVGNMLRSLGVVRGDRVGLATKNRVEMAFVEFGAQRIGAVPVPINYMLRAEEIQQLMSDCGCRVLVTDRSVFEENIRDRTRVPSVETWIMVSTRPLPGFHDFGGEIECASEELDAVELAESDLSVIFYTAGTTGLPKGAMLSNGALMFAFRHYARLRAFIPFSKRDLALLVMPLAHTGGHQALLLQMALGSPTYLMGRFVSTASDSERPWTIAPLATARGTDTVNILRNNLVSRV